VYTLKNHFDCLGPKKICSAIFNHLSCNRTTEKKRETLFAPTCASFSLSLSAPHIAFDRATNWKWCRLFTSLKKGGISFIII
jgi:hypothetical protein